MDGPKFAVLSTSDGPTPKRLAGRIRVWNDRRRSSHRSRGTPPSGVRAANDIFSLRHRHQSLRQRLLLGRIAPLHDIIVLHAVDARPVPPVCGGKLADIAGPQYGRGSGHQLDADPPRLSLRLEGRRVGNEG